MFDSIVSKITNTACNVARIISAALNQSPWIVPVAILLVVLLG